MFAGPATRAPSGSSKLAGSASMVGWPRPNAETTRTVDDAIEQRDKAVIDRLGMDGKIGWFDLTCTRFDYERSWDRFPEEREEVEESYSADQLEQLHRAETKYFFRCGTRPCRTGACSANGDRPHERRP